MKIEKKSSSFLDNFLTQETKKLYLKLQLSIQREEGRYFSIFIFEVLFHPSDLSFFFPRSIEASVV